MKNLRPTRHIAIVLKDKSTHIIFFTFNLTSCALAYKRVLKVIDNLRKTGRRSRVTLHKSSELLSLSTSVSSEGTSSLAIIYRRQVDRPT